MGLFVSAINANLVVFFFFKVETVIAYPPAALGATVKLHMGFQIGFLKGGVVFLFP